MAGDEGWQGSIPDESRNFKNNNLRGARTPCFGQKGNVPHDKILSATQTESTQGGEFLVRIAAFLRPAAIGGGDP